MDIYKEERANLLLSNPRVSIGLSVNQHNHASSVFSFSHKQDEVF